MSSSKYIHGELYRVFGSARNHVCPCGAPAREWAYQYTAGNQELRTPEGTGPHSLNLDDYVAMCRPCHRAFDIKNDEELVRRMKEGGSRGGAARAARMQVDFEFGEKMRDALERGRSVAAERFRTDPELKERTRQAQSRAANTRRRCDECGLISNPGGMGRHQQQSGHSGWTATKGLDATG